MSALEITEFRRVHRRKGNADSVALRGVTLDIPEGETHGLPGPNGAGNGTLDRTERNV